MGVSSGGGYVVESLLGDYFPSLVPYHPTILSKLAVFQAPPSGGRLFPVGTNAVTTTWQVGDTGTITEGAEQFGQAASSVHTLSAYLNASRLLLIQSDADNILAMELGRAASTAFLQAL